MVGMDVFITSWPEQELKDEPRKRIIGFSLSSLLSQTSHNSIFSERWICLMGSLFSTRCSHLVLHSKMWPSALGCHLSSVSTCTWIIRSASSLRLSPFIPVLTVFYSFGVIVSWSIMSNFWQLASPARVRDLQSKFAVAVVRPTPRAFENLMWMGAIPSSSYLIVHLSINCLNGTEGPRRELRSLFG